ncbi:efflux RND transporter periplasmic adaptor subunit [candidate division KSB3 bacterium]|uniref:Efflux RND transporter periplasmic adaptor subunit n=1 Tax=candidate division KSB3 bacterium TaxID=2044937 RepID=A0A9D5JVQ5_9BACT|nr:efflux RND transporter periplasmic adaptor subunit [candidate division KSB3 bacterium]MBD3325023.1 efflux RND transporter periplasmic adaptor subunit [candidate division KSB3 bacterium]
MKSKTKRHLIVYFCALLVIGGLFAGTKVYVSRTQQKISQTQQEAVAQTKADVENRLQKVKVVELLPVPFTDMLVLPGTVSPHEDIDLAAKTGGTIDWIGPKEGQRVTKDEKLLQVNVSSIQTQVAEVRATYNQALKDYERIKKLYEEDITSKERLDNAKTTLERAKAALDSAMVSLRDGTLFSPIDGVVDRLHVDPGEFINRGQAVMKIVDIDQVYIELAIPEKDILYFQEGQSVDITMTISGRAGCESTNEMIGQQECQFTGTLDFISMTAEPSTRTYLVKAVVENPDQILRPGMIARAHLIRRQLEDAIAVPFFTIIDREEGKAVFVVEEGVAHVRPIQYGTFYKGLVEIRSGLQLGEQLVIVGQRNLVDGQRVEVTENITPLARQWISQGKDLSELSIDILR